MNALPLVAAPPLVPSRATGAPTRAATPPLEILKITRILVPTDFSQPAHQALHYAERMARRFGAALTLLHVFELPVYARGLAEYPMPDLTHGDQQRLYADVMAQVEERLNILQDQLKQSLDGVDTMIRTGSPYEHIVEAAKETGADLIVIATHGYTGLKHLFLGSTAERVVRLAPCPVLVVREQKKRGFATNASADGTFDVGQALR